MAGLITCCVRKGDKGDWINSQDRGLRRTQIRKRESKDHNHWLRL